MKTRQSELLQVFLVCFSLLLSIFQRENEEPTPTPKKICKVKRAKSSRKNTRTRFSEGCLHIFPPFFIFRVFAAAAVTLPRRGPARVPLPLVHVLLLLPILLLALAKGAFTFMAHKTWQGGDDDDDDDGHKFKKQKKMGEKREKNEKKI